MLHCLGGCLRRGVCQAERCASSACARGEEAGGWRKKGGKLYHDHHLSRKTKGTGKAKKNGGGGKFTWGNLMDANEYLEDGVADEGDPNWDSEQEDLGSISLVEAKLVEIVAYKDAVWIF
eukprot:jgi/Picre1/34645/NNA_002113.t1